MQRLLGFTFCLTLAFALACTASDSPMTALDDGNLTLAGGSGSVNGSANLHRTYDTGTYRNVTINADSKGGVTGKITFVNHFGDLEDEDGNRIGTGVSQIDVYCMLITGNTAVLGGTITRDDLAPERVGLDLILKLVDNGQGKNAAPDEVSQGHPRATGGAQLACDGGPLGGAGTTYPVENGNVTIRP